MVVVRDDTRAGDLLSIAESLTHGSERELIIVRLLTADADVTAATDALTAQREALVAHGVSVRVVLRALEKRRAGERPRCRGIPGGRADASSAAESAPSGVAPRDTLTRFTWTIASAGTP